METRDISFIVKAHRIFRQFRLATQHVENPYRSTKFETFLKESFEDDFLDKHGDLISQDQIKDMISSNFDGGIDLLEDHSAYFRDKHHICNI